MRAPCSTYHWKSQWCQSGVQVIYPAVIQLPIAYIQLRIAWHSHVQMHKQRSVCSRRFWLSENKHFLSRHWVLGPCGLILAPATEKMFSPTTTWFRSCLQKMRFWEVVITWSGTMATTSVKIIDAFTVSWLLWSRLETDHNWGKCCDTYQQTWKKLLAWVLKNVTIRVQQISRGPTRQWFQFQC